MQSMCTPQKLSLEFHIEASKFLCVSRGKKYLFFGKFGIFCFLETLVFRIAILPYYWRIMLNAESPEQYPFLKPAPLAVSSPSFSSELLKIHLNFSSSKFFWAWFLFGWCFICFHWRELPHFCFKAPGLKSVPSSNMPCTINAHIRISITLK